MSGESGSQYAMDKVKICRMGPIVLTELDMIPYLIRGLNRPEHAAAVMGNLPVTIEQFVTRIRLLEQIGYHGSTATTATPSSIITVPVIPDAHTARIDTLSSQMSTLTAAVQSLVNRPRASWNPQPRAPYQAASTGSIPQQNPQPFRPATPSSFRSSTPQGSQIGSGRGQQFTPRSHQLYIPRPRTPLNELQCWTCGHFGHLQRDCPDLEGQGWASEQ